MKRNIRQSVQAQRETKAGFTILEVMLFLAISSLMLIGVLAGAFISVSSKRYSEAVDSFSEYLRATYGEVISPESLGAGNSNYAILGKVIVIGHEYENNYDDTNRVWSATLIGKSNIPRQTYDNFLDELDDASISLYCGKNTANVDIQNSTVAAYSPLWQGELKFPTDSELETHYPDSFKGTFIIARAPTSGTVHTVFAKDLTYDLRDACTPNDDHASSRFREQFHESVSDSLSELYGTYSLDHTVGICYKTSNFNVVQEIRVAADGRNTSAINIVEADSEENQCH